MRCRWNSAHALFLLMAVVLLAQVVPESAIAQSTTDTQSGTYKLNRLFYYQGGKSARQAFLAHPDAVDIFAPQSYFIDSFGNLTGNVDPVLLDFAQKNSIKVMPLVTNGKFSQSTYQAILDDPAKQQVAINMLVSEAKQHNYWGWQIDFEQMDASYRDKYSAFIANLDVAMKQNNLALSVAVVAQVSSNPADYPNNLWQKLVGAYDYGALASSTDFISVMSYDDPNSTGPVVEYSWLQKVLTYSLSLIPKEKLSLGIPFYYWQWSDTSGKRIGIGGNYGIQRILSRRKVTFNYDAVQQEPYLHYFVRSKGYTVWYENAQSVTQKLALIKQNNLYGFSAWALGLAVPSVYNVIEG